MNSEQINKARDIVDGYDKSATMSAIAIEGERAIDLLRELLAAAPALAAPSIPRLGCSDRASCREAGFCMDGEKLCDSRQ